MEPFQYRIIGTSHVSQDSVKQIEEEILKYRPDYVCVELDRQRLEGLLTNQKSDLSPKLIFRIGLFGYLFALVGNLVQKRIGKSLNIIPGSDMLSAVKKAKKHNIPVVLIDQHISITLKNVSRNFGFKEKLRLIKDIFIGIFMPKRALRKMQKDIGIKTIDLKSVPSDEIVEKMILKLKEQYPGLYRALVSDRNHYMANRLFFLMKKNPEKKFLAVVGAGHKKDMDEILKTKLLKVEYIRTTNETYT